MFELLFHYPLTVWRDATLVFQSGWSAMALGAVWLVGLVLIVVTLLRRELSVAKRSWVGVLQGIALGAVLAMLWRPALEVERLSPGENAIAWLFDDSRSMAVEDVADRSRRAAALEALEAGELLEDGVFAVELHATGAAAGARARPLDGLDGWRATAEGSAIATGIEDLLSSVEDRGLAAVVLVSDGAETSTEVDADWWRRLAAAGVPVHTVGVGASERVADVELADVSLPPSVVEGGEVVARLEIAHPSGGGTTRLRVERGGELVHAEDIELDAGRDRTRHVARFAAGRPGLGELRFSLGDGDDPHPFNDEQRRLLEVADSRRRVLYVEGEPRWEFKFVRRALHDDPEIELVTLLRTSANKFYRQGVRDADELADGFPTTREALFGYDAIVIGSLEAAELDLDQQAALRDFVSVRGGSLLLLGGRAALADGGWARSAVAPALPVVLGSRRDAGTFRRERIAIVPTVQGARTDWLSLTDRSASSASAREDAASAGVLDAEADSGFAPSADPGNGPAAGSVAESVIDPMTDRMTDPWADLPELADRQSVGRVKPGAVVLLETVGAGEPVWVTQRYGLGRSHVFGTSGTWRWQMGLPSEDQRHERFWRGVFAALVAERPDRLRVETPLAVVRDDGDAPLTFWARSATFEPLDADALTAELIAPDGRRQPLALSADLSRPGRFEAAAETPLDGPWSVEISAVEPGESPGSAPVTATARWLVQRDTAEDFDRLQRVGFLERIADTTGGRYLPLDRLDELPALLERENAATTREARLPVWNMPILFLLLIGARGLEWWSRWRWKRL